MEQKKLKGITENFTKTKIFDEYVNCLNWDPSKGGNEFIANVDNYVCWSKKHEMFLQFVNKLALNAFNDKRIIWTISKVCRAFIFNYVNVFNNITTE